MLNGYTGKILKVDLSAAKLEIDTPDEAFYRRYMGGSALNLAYVLRDMPPGVDPLGPENVLALSVGGITGASVSGQSRMTATAKSPLSGAVGDSQCGGFWPARLKFAGFDAIIIYGKSPAPVYLWINDGQAEIRDAGHLWGKPTGETEAAIREELGLDKIEVLQIGPAGEQLVRYGALINMCNRANGRTGMGAVMGSKQLKAIAVRGNQRPSVADKAALKELAKWGAKNFPVSMISGLGKYGTAETVSGQQQVGGLPTHNFNSGVFKGWQAITGKTLYAELLRGSAENKQDTLGRDTCFGCVVRCKRVVEIEEGPYPVDPLYGGPEYETLATFGSYCGVDDLAAVCKANELCNAYGMDTISCGATIAWAMEVFEAGLLSPDAADGFEIRFGDADGMLRLVRMIGEREGFGRLLGEGSQRAASQLGVGSECLITSKGQEAPAHMPQTKRSLALIYATNPFGADHESSDHDSAIEPGAFDAFAERSAAIGLTKAVPATVLNADKVEFARITQCVYSFLDSANLCQFVWGNSWQLYGPQQIVALVQAVTGWDVTMEEVLAVGERRLNMMRVFNAREGFDRRQDTLPQKFFNRPLSGGASDGLCVDKTEFDAALNEYYRQCGWNSDTGNPTAETLRRLDLEWLVDG